MPVYNGGAYFRKALESALAQDYENIEIVVVNDGSTDGGETEAIAASYGKRVRYFSQQNRGVAGALNTALQHATGEYFAWLSHDDIHLPHKTSAQIRYLKDLGRSDACLFSDYELIGPADEHITTVTLNAGQIRFKPRIALLNGMVNGCTLLIPMKFMKEYGPFDESLRYTQDYDFWKRILRDHEFFHQAECLVQYRIHPGQDSHKPQAVAEGDVLWKQMVSDLSETERAHLFGSTHRYFKKLGDFLDITPYKEAAAYSHAKSNVLAKDTLITVIIPFWNEVPLALRAAKSALAQVNARVEVILVNDGSTDDLSPLFDLCAKNARVRLMHQANSGPAAARNRALLAASGDYIAFLDADDLLLATKVERQVELMQAHGAQFSHTSYYVSFPGTQRGLGIWRSGKFGGQTYPAIIGCCPIAMPTVMLHRSVVDGGFLFPTSSRIGEDILGWVDLAAKYLLLGIDEPLSVVEWSRQSAALSIEKQALGLSSMIALFNAHEIYSVHRKEIGQLQDALDSIARRWVSAGRNFAEVKEGPEIDMAKIAWETPAGFLEDTGGRTQYQ